MAPVKDSRLYGRFTLDFPDSPKILPLSDKAFRALVEMTLYSRQLMTDGFLSERLALAKWGPEACQELLENDPVKPSLLRVENGYQIHDFAEHQSTRADIERATEVRKAAGRKGGLAKARRKLEQTSSKTCPETETETVKESKPKLATDPDPEGFAEWYEPYPKKVGRGQAVKAYRAAAKKASAEELLAGVKAYAESVRGTESRYIANPASWLNAERWTDEKPTGGPRKIAGGLYQE